jgi:hypothetical protein
MEERALSHGARLPGQAKLTAETWMPFVPEGSHAGSLVLSVVVLGGGVETLRGGALWEVIRSLGVLPYAGINADLP